MGDECGVFGVVQRREGEQRVDCREPGIAGAHAVAPVLFEVIKERADERCVQSCEVELDGRDAGPLLGEGQQQPERVSVGGDGVFAGASLVDQPLGEEGLQGGCERAHDGSPVNRSSSSAASAISSGAADTYQYVAAGLMCPRYVESSGIRAWTSMPSRYQRSRVLTANE